MLPLEFSTYTHAYQGYMPLKASKTWEAKTDLLQHTCTLVHTSHFHTTLLMLWTPEAQQILPQWLTNQWTVQQQLAPLLSISNSGLIFKLKKKNPHWAEHYSTVINKSNDQISNTRLLSLALLWKNHDHLSFPGCFPQCSRPMPRGTEPQSVKNKTFWQNKYSIM